MSGELPFYCGDNTTEKETSVESLWCKEKTLRGEKESGVITEGRVVCGSDVIPSGVQRRMGVVEG